MSTAFNPQSANTVCQIKSQLIQMIQLAWRFLRFQKNSALARWYQARTADRRAGTRKTMIVALARKLLIALWRFVTTGETLEGVVLRPAA